MERPNSEPLDLESVACFIEAYRQPSFRAAAARRHLSPAAFGERIAKLEQHLGVELFRRTTRKVTPTEAGARFVEAAERLLAVEREAKSVALDADAPFELTLGTRFELGLSWLLPALGPLAEARPARRIHLGFGDTPALLRRLRDRQLDGVVTSARVSTTGLGYVALHPETYAFVASPELEPIERPEDASAHVLVDAAPDLPLFRYFLDAAPPEPSWRFARHEYMGTIAAVRARILEGLGVGVLPEYYVRDALDSGALVRVQPELQPRADVFRLMYLEDQPRARELRRLGDALRAFPLR